MWDGSLFSETSVCLLHALPADDCGTKRKENTGPGFHHLAQKLSAQLLPVEQIVERLPNFY